MGKLFREVALRRHWKLNSHSCQIPVNILPVVFKSARSGRASFSDRRARMLTIPLTTYPLTLRCFRMLSQEISIRDAPDVARPGFESPWGRQLMLKYLQKSVAGT